MTNIFVAGHRGMVGSALVRQLSERSNVHIITRTRAELDLTDQAAVRQFFAKEAIDEVYRSLKGEFNLEDKGELDKYLGIEIERRADDSIRLRQPFLIDRIIQAIKGMTEANTKSTPATKPVLGRERDGAARKHDFHYCSVIGMLNFLTSSSRPEAQFAVHQCARFSADPKLAHEKAVKRVC